MKFAVFILSHKRADRVETYDTLRKGGYTGKIYVVVDNQDPMLEKYQERFGDSVLVFDKQMYIDRTETLETSKMKSSAVYARNAIEQYAKDFVLDVFGMFDDDVVNMRYRWVDGNTVRSLTVNGGLDLVFESYAQYILDTGIACTSFPFTMFYVSGIHDLDKRISEYRHTYQIHIRNAHKPVEWIGIINHDTISQLLTMKLGYIWWSIPHIVFDAKPMNKESGGLKEVYDAFKDFDMAFLAVMTCPDCCTVTASNGERSTLQIKENKHTSYPMIISGRYKK